MILYFWASFKKNSSLSFNYSKKGDIIDDFSQINELKGKLLSTGYVGYAKALDTYQKGKNVKFSTYAYRCIKNEILYFLRREKRHRDNDVSLFKPLSTDKNGNIIEEISADSQ